MAGQRARGDRRRAGKIDKGIGIAEPAFEVPVLARDTDFPVAQDALVHADTRSATGI